VANIPTTATTLLKDPGISEPLIESFETVFASQQDVSHEPPSTAESLLRHVGLPSDHLKDDSPMISTLQDLGTTISPDGRYVSNTFDYLPSDAKPHLSTTATEYKIYRCEDEPQVQQLDNGSRHVVHR
jgi:hypothetical protein